MNYEKYQYSFTAKHLRLFFGGYLFFLMLMAVLPINGTANTTLTDVFIVNIRLDHLLHATLFIPWAFLYLLTFHPLKWNEKLMLVIYGLFMAFATEGIQYFLTYRSYNINDMIANLMGVMLGMVVLVGRIGVLKWSEGAKGRWSERAKERGSEGARERGSERAKGRGSEGARERRSDGAKGRRGDGAKGRGSERAKGRWRDGGTEK